MHGRYTFVVDILPDFERDVLRGRQPELQVNIDATAMLQAAAGASYIQGIVSDELLEFGHRPGTASPVSTRTKFNPNLTSTWFVSVMELINNVTMLAMIIAGGALIREREHGTVEHLLVMPLRPYEIMLAKVWANGLRHPDRCGLRLVVHGAWTARRAHRRLRATLPCGHDSLFGVGRPRWESCSPTLARSMPQFGLLFILVVLR